MLILVFVLLLSSGLCVVLVASSMSLFLRSV